MSSRNLSKLIKKRSVWRQSATKLMAKIDSALSVNVIPWDEVLEFEKQLEGKSKDMEAINEIIENLTELVDYDDEVTASQDYLEQIWECRTKVKILRGRSLLNKQKKIKTSSRIEGSEREVNKGFLVASHDPQRKILFTHTIGAAIENKVGSSEAVEKVLSGRLQSSPTKASEERRVAVDKLSEGANKKSHSKSFTEAFDPVEKGALSNQRKESKSKDEEKVRSLDRRESSKASTKPKDENKSPSMEKSPKKKPEGPVISVRGEVDEKNSDDVGSSESTGIAEVILRESKPSVNGKKSENIGSTEAADETKLDLEPSVNENSLKNVDSAETARLAEVVMMEPRNSSAHVKEDLGEIKVDSHKAKPHRGKSHRKFYKNEQEDLDISISGEVNDKKLENVGSTETDDGDEVTVLDPEPSVDEKFENVGSAKTAEGAEVILMELKNEKEDLGGIEEVDSHNGKLQTGKRHRLS